VGTGGDVLDHWSHEQNFRLANNSKIKLSISTQIRNIQGADVQLHSFINSVSGGEWLISRPGRSTPRIETRYQLNRRTVKSQSRYVRSGAEKNLFVQPGFVPRMAQRVA
jgi:hypothetical protein